MSRPKKILFVDDDPLTLEIARSSLNGGRIDLSCAAGGREALELCTTQNFDMAVVDIYMPEMSGLELMKQIRSHSNIDHVRLVAISVSINPRTVDDAFAAGAQNFFHKPLNWKNFPNQLLDMLNTDCYTRFVA